jgi:GT2 family glycosyltransferase
MGSHPKVGIVLVNWNGKEDTIECLESLRGISYPDYEVLLVDNASTDGSREYFIKHYPYVDLIFNEENLGFAEGNNVGIGRALEKGADYVLLLNNDTVVEPDFLSGIVATAESDPGIGIVSPKICFYYDPDKVWAVGGTINMFTGSIGNYCEGAPQAGIKGVRSVDYATGCALLIKAGAIGQIGLLDKDYFLYFEDTDWNVRAHEHGYKSVVNCDVRILHKSGASVSKIKDSSYYYMARNIPLFIRKNGKLYHKVVFYPIFSLHYLGVFIYHWVKGDRQKSINVLKGLRDFLLKKYGKVAHPTIPAIE